MKLNVQPVALVFITMLLITSGNAGEPFRKFLGCPVPDCIGKWCCDDYQGKSLPCIKVPLCFGCDNYCRKTIPRVCTPLCFTCDDYCRKCQPSVCRPPLISTLRCIPKSGGCGSTSRSTKAFGEGVVTGKRVTASLISKNSVASGRSAIAVDAGETEVGRNGARNTGRPVIIEHINR